MNQISNSWQVQIQGCKSDLDHLARHFVSSPYRISVDERGDGFVFLSDSFLACQTSQQVLKLANEELTVLSGVLRVTLRSPEPLRAGAVYKCNASGGRDVFVHIHEGVQTRAEFGEVTVTVTGANGNIITMPALPPRTVSIAQLASTDIAVTKAMRLIALPDHKTWVGMYRIFEVIVSDVGGERIIKRRGWGSAQDLNRFKHSANSVAVAGDSARHGKEKDEPPRKPMSLVEASAYLNNILHLWLSSKGV